MAAQSRYEVDIVIEDGQAKASISGLTKGLQGLTTVVNLLRESQDQNTTATIGTNRYYKEQIKLAEEVRDRTAKTSQEYLKATKEIDDLRLAQEKLTTEVVKAQAPQEGTLAFYKKEIASLRAEQQQLAKNNDSWEDYENRINDTKNKIEALTGATRMSIKPNQDLVSNAGLAGATLTEFSRTISDLPYGIQGVANNLGQLSTLFITFVSKSGGFKNAIAGLVTQLTGPLGWILALQAGITALEFFSKSEDKAKRAAKELEEQILNTTTAIKDQNKALQDRANDERRVQILTQASLKAAREFLDEAKKATAEFTEEGFAKAESAMLEISRLLKNAGIENAKLLADETIGIEQRILIGNKLVEQSNKRKQLAEEEKKLFEASARFTDAENKKKQATGEFEEKVQDKRAKAQQAIISSAEYQILQLNAGLKEIDDSIAILSQGVILNPKGESDNARKISTILRDLNDELAILRADEFEARRIQAQQEERDTIAKIKEERKEEVITAQEAEKAIALAKDLRVEKEKQIEKDKAEYLLDLTEKQLREEERNSERLITAKEKTAKDALGLIDRETTRRINAEKKVALDGIKDKKLLQAEFNRIDQENIRKQIEVVEATIAAGLVGSEVGLDVIDRLQSRLLSLGLSAADTAGREQNPQKRLERTLRQLQEGFNFITDLAQASLDAEMSIEEARTAKLNNSLRLRLRNEKLTAEQREAINNQIARNEESLQQKRDKIAEKQFKLQKAIAIGQALITTYEMATRAYNAVLAGPEKFLGISALALAKVAAATATLFGLAQVRAISRQQFVPSAISSGSGGGGEASAPTVQAPSFNVVGQSNVSQLAAVVQGQLDRPVKTYVVASDVSTAQELERKKISTATI